MGERERRRRERMREVMEKNGLGGYLIVDPVNVSYLTGFNGEDSYLWFGDGEAQLLSDSRFEQQIQEECPDVPAKIRKSGQSILGLLAAATSINGVPSRLPERVGIESFATTVALRDALLEKFPNVSFVARSSDVERLRAVKDEGEIAAIRGAIDASIRAYRFVRSTVEQDASEVDVRDELEYRMRKEGADDVSFPSIVAFDERAALPHAIPGRGGRFGDANMVLIDWGAKKDGYVGDLTRSFLTERGRSAASGDFRDKFSEIFKIVKDAHDKAIEAIKPGVLCRDIDKIARDAIRDAGYGDFFGHGLGHGIGRVVHDFGGFSPNADAPLENNMVMTVEPGIYLPGWGGIRIEDDVLVSETGCETLSIALPTDE